MKSLMVLTALMAVCGAQLSLPFSATFGDGQFIIRWGIIPTNGMAEIEIQANCTGWVSIMLASADGKFADVHLGIYNATMDQGFLWDMHLNLTTPHGLPDVDASQDLILQGAIYHAPWTIIRMKRLANTGDASNDVSIITGPMTLGWAYSNSNDISVPHVNAGLETVTLLPVPEATTVFPTTSAANQNVISSTAMFSIILASISQFVSPLF